MSGTYKVIEIVGTSDKSYAEATRNAVVKAAQTLHGLSWFEAKEFRGSIKDDAVSEFQVVLKVGFRLD